ncbi:MAG: response regulator transcription factor [Vicinamibacterales bacterium]
MPGARILVVDDEPHIRRSLAVSLEGRGFEVSTAESAEDALRQCDSQLPDVLIVDVLLPGLDGIELVKQIRTRSAVPIIVLSAIGEERKKVEALELGADDYVTKPFGVDELLARTRTVLRRAAGVRGPRAVLEQGELRVDVESREVRLGSELLKLTPTEFDLLRFLMQQAGKVLTHRMLLTEVWGPDFENHVQYLRVFVGQLRKKIERDPARPRYLLTETGVGYRFAQDAES